MECSQVLIGGSWVAAERGTYPVIDPATEEPVGAAPQASVAQAEAAARAAREAFDSGPWPRLPGAERAALLEKAAEKFRSEMGALVDLTISETGAVRRVAEPQQVGAVVNRLSANAALARLAFDESLPPRTIASPTGERLASGLVAREPVGVVACITPYNFPMTNCAGKIGPALACGNTCIVKPAPVDPLAVSELCRIVDSVLPPGVLNFICGSEPDLGAALVKSPDVDMISFTGSTEVGIRIQAAGAPTMKRLLLELGGKSAQIVFADADLDQALRGAMSVWAFHSGQICIAGTRLLVERSIYESFTSRLAAAAASIAIGDPRDPNTVMGPLVSALQRDRVEHYVAQGLAEGATLACGGRRPPHLERGYYFEPTLFTGVRNDMTIAREEIFGPVIAAIPFDDESDAVALANDSEFGLYGYVWSRDLPKAVRVARALRTGTVQINGSTPNPEAPFGGYKRSGVGRDGGRYAIEAYTELKYIGWTA